MTTQSDSLRQLILQLTSLAPQMRQLLGDRWPALSRWLDHAMAMRLKLDAGPASGVASVTQAEVSHHIDQLFALLAGTAAAKLVRDPRMEARVTLPVDDVIDRTLVRPPSRGGFSTALPSKPQVFYFALTGERVRGSRLLVGTRAVLSLDFGVPGATALQSLKSAGLDAALRTDADIDVDLAPTGGLTIEGNRRGVARCRGGRLQEALTFNLVAASVGTAHIHAAFSVKGETICQCDLELQVVADGAELDDAPQPGSVATAVVDAVLEQAAAVSAAPQRRIKLSLGYDGGRFCIDLQDLVGGETDFADRYISRDIDKAKLDTLLKAVRDELAPSYAGGVDFWIRFDGSAAAVAAPAAQKALERTMETVASAGWLLFSQLASDAHIGEALRYVDAVDAPGATLTIDTDDLFLPWEIVYGAFHSRNMTEKQKAETPLAAKRFWGARFAIETLQRGGNVPLGKLRATHRGAPPKVSINLNPTIALDKLDADAQPLARLREWAQRLLDGGRLEGINDQCDEIRSVLQEASGDARIVYVYCHGGPPSPITGASEFLQLDADCDLRPGDLGPTARFKNAPIIVVNACAAGAFSPLTLSNFLQAFRAHGALGLICATGAVPILFGVRFGEELVQCCLDRTGSLASAVLALRQEHVLNRGNPVPLLYSVECQI